MEDRAAALAALMPILDGHPRPDWAAIAETLCDVEEASLDDRWWEVARTWVGLTARNLGGDYRVTESAGFLLLSALDPRTTELLLAFLQRASRRIGRVLFGDATAEEDRSRQVVMIFDSQDAYYSYVAHFYEEGEHALSGGMYLHRDYGHIAMPFIDLRSAETTLAHELTHAYLGHLPIPAWLNEGLAVTLEEQICQERPSTLDAEALMRHRAYWNEETIQDFWTGASFDDVGEGSPLSYELARLCVSTLSQDPSLFYEFIATATWEDGGEAACREVYGPSLGDLVEQYFGPGNWSPRPQAAEQ